MVKCKFGRSVHVDVDFVHIRREFSKDVVVPGPDPETAADAWSALSDLTEVTREIK
jgi:hypothetical protein